MEGTIATTVFGAGRRTAAALAALLALTAAIGANVALASDRKAAKEESAGAVHRASPSASKQNEPATASVGRVSPFDTSGRARTTPYESFSGVTQPTPNEKLLVELINVERTSRGIKPVAWDGMLSGIARMHSADMRSVHRASHSSSNDGATYSQRLARTPYRASAAAENVAYNADVVKAHRALMASAGHRHNILDPTLTAVGVAVMMDFKDDWVFVVEDFATPMAHVSDEEAARLMGESLVKSRGGIFRLEEDKALSRQLDELVEEMIDSGAVKKTVPGGVGSGWTLAFTAMDPRQPPKSALERASKANGYGLAVQFRKTKKYPFGAYWAILFLKGEY